MKPGFDLKYFIAAIENKKVVALDSSNNSPIKCFGYDKGDILVVKKANKVDTKIAIVYYHVAKETSHQFHTEPMQCFLTSVDLNEGLLGNQFKLIEE